MNVTKKHVYLTSNFRSIIMIEITNNWKNMQKINHHCKKFKQTNLIFVVWGIFFTVMLRDETAWNAIAPRRNTQISYESAKRFHDRARTLSRRNPVHDSIADYRPTDACSVDLQIARVLTFRRCCRWCISCSVRYNECAAAQKSLARGDAPRLRKTVESTSDRSYRPT